MLINLRNALMAGKRLPYDAEVEYLESSGTQYIDTGVIAGDDTTFSVRFNCTSTNDTAIYGGRSQSQGRQWILPLQMNQIQFGYGSVYQNINVQYRGNWLNIDTSLSAESYTYKVTTDGGVETLVSTPRQSFTNTAHILLFAAWNNTAVGYKTVAKVAKFQIWKNGVLVRDFIPVRKGTVGYLYDRVSGKLFGNAGTGDFVLGQDVVPVEYIESHGTEYIDTGILTTSTDRMEFDLAITGYSTSSPSIVGTGGIASGMVYSFRFPHNSTRRVEAYYAPATELIFSGYPHGDFHHYIMDHVNGFAQIDDNIQYSQAQLSGTGYKIFIFAYSNKGVANMAYGIIGKLKYLKLSSSGAFTREYIPVRVGTGATSWEGAMMDALTRRIYRNAGTGAFTYGNDLKYPIPSE